MRFTRYATHAAVVCATLLAPFAASAAPSKEILDLQREIGLMSDQLTTLQKADAASLASLQSTMQQIADSQAKTSSTVSSLNSTLVQTLQNELKNMHDQLGAVTGLSVKIGNISEDVSNLGGTVRGIQETLNKQNQMLSDLANQIKLMQAPAPPPPSSDGSAPAPTAAAPQQPSAQTLFDNAKRDLDASRFELAISGYKEFLRLYPSDPNAAAGQYNLGNAYYQMSDLGNAVKAYDAVIERYDPKDASTPSASANYMKGKALQKQNNKTAAIASFQTVVTEFPHSPEAPMALRDLRSLGVTPKKPRK